MRKQIELGATAVAALILSLLLMGAEKCPQVPGPGPTPTPTPEPTPTPTPTPVPTPTPEPPPPPPPCAIPDVGATLVSPRPPAEFSDALNSVMVSLTACEVGSRCVVAASLDVFLNQVVATLRSRGICAGRQEGGTADEVCIGSSMRCQGYHAYTCSADCNKGTVGWAPGSVRDTWVGQGGVTPGPQPTPTPTPTPEPTPPSQGWAPPPPLGLILLKNAGVNRPVVDATPKCKGQPAWCAAWSTGGSNCPGGTEANPGQRQQVEAIWGPWGWSIDGADCLASGACWLDGGNPLRVVAPGSQGKLVRVTGGNGVFAEIVAAVAPN